MLLLVFKGHDRTLQHDPHYISIVPKLNRVEPVSCKNPMYRWLRMTWIGKFIRKTNKDYERIMMAKKMDFCCEKYIFQIPLKRVLVMSTCYRQWQVLFVCYSLALLLRLSLPLFYYSLLKPLLSMCISMIHRILLKNLPLQKSIYSLLFSRYSILL